MSLPKFGNLIFIAVIGFVLYRFGQTYMSNAKLEGKKFKNFDVETLSGDPATFESITEYPIVIVYWNTGCIPCLVELMRFNTAIKNEEFPSKSFVAVNIGEKGKHVSEFMHQKDWSFNVLLDVKMRGFKSLGLVSTPTVLHVDEKKIIEYVGSGVSPLIVRRSRKFLVGR